MKTKQGFTLIELVVACTLLMILSTVATTTAENFVQAVKQLQTTNKVWSLKFTLAQAELAYANAIATGTVTDPTAISHWNLLIQENDSADLIPTLAPYFQMPNITDFASLLQRVGMYDQNTPANNPTIQLTTFTATSPNPATVATLPTVSWQGITL
jgi:prepilin-type N-terminal cleavage/methylation domain-containing protein